MFISLRNPRNAKFRLSIRECEINIVKMYCRILCSYLLLLEDNYYLYLLLL